MKLQAQLQQIIEDQKVLQASESKLQVQIAEKEDRLNELAGPLLATMLPDEILMKILGYLSTHDVLGNVARVSKKFKKLSEEPSLIKRFEMKFIHDDQIRDCLKILRRSQNLRFFSCDLDGVPHQDEYDDFPHYENFLNELPSLNHQHLEEFQITEQGLKSPVLFYEDVLFIRELIKYLEKCSKLKILKFEFKSAIYLDWFLPGYYSAIFLLGEKNDFTLLKSQKLEELHLNGFAAPEDPQDFRKVIETFHGNFPNLQRLCLELHHGHRDIDRLLGTNPEYDQILQEFASEKNVKIEIKSTPVYKSIEVEEQPSRSYKNFNPVPK